MSNDVRNDPANVRRPARHGFTLVELLIVVTVASLALTSVGIALHVLFDVERRMRRDEVSTIALTRLSLKLRSDAHAAKSAKVLGPDGSAGVEFAMPDDYVVEYRTEPLRVLRIRRHGETMEHQEVYSLPDNSAVLWQVAVNQPPTIVSLEISHPQANADGARRVVQLEAALGLDIQYMPTQP